MSKSVFLALDELGVRLRDVSSGKWQKCQCPFPECQGKKNKNFAVRVEDEFVGYVCHRCGAKGGISYGDKAESRASGISSHKGPTQSRKNDWRPDYNGPPIR